MTQIIDHAIQIPVSPSNMWTLVSNPENNPRWQSECRSIAFLNSIRRGIGMRWRYEMPNGKSCVAEVTAWYEGLGFEYTLVDGTAFVSNKGRIRLQEVPEGTIVQWTFSYEISGMLAGLRNTLSVKRSLDTQIVESLRNLFRVAKDVYREADIKDSKALMRDAPNVQERLSYKPRYPSVLEEGKPRPVSNTPSREVAPVRIPTPSAEVLYQRPSIEEPPIAVDDTKPNPVLRQTAEMTAASASSKSIMVEDAASEPSRDSPAAPVIQSNESSMAAMPQLPLPAPLASYVPTEPLRPVEPLVLKVDLTKLDKRDTATISVFELFGLPRPSNTQEMAAITVTPVADPITPVADTPVPVITEMPVVVIPPAIIEVPSIVETTVIDVPTFAAPPVVEVGSLPSTPVIDAGVAQSSETTVIDVPTFAAPPVVEVGSLPSTPVIDAGVAQSSEKSAMDERYTPLISASQGTDDLFTRRIVPDVVYQAPRPGLRRRLRQRLVRLRLNR